MAVNPKSRSRRGDDASWANAAPRWRDALAVLDTLTAREREVFDLLGAGRSNREISLLLQISERTVKKHVGSILVKLELESRLQIGLTALTHRLEPALTA
jgi:DNA-binding NarL/FixJ family response regulator